MGRVIIETGSKPGKKILEQNMETKIIRKT